MRTLDVLSALSALGGLPSLVNTVKKCARYAIRWLRRGQRRFPLAILMTCLLSLLTLPGCAPLTIRESKSLPHVPATPGSPNTIRTLGTDQRSSELSAQEVAQRVMARHGGEPFNILALSGGGTDGAFGAGALVGLTRSGMRPEFAVVTGVSAGALIAPYAFLGPAWDDQLSDAYTAGRAEDLLQSRGLGVLFGSSVYRGTPLKALVNQYLTDAMVQAVGREAAAGRLLLVATTDVGTGEAVVWDLGSIALNGGRNARTLLRDILVASASVPGMFPPVIIRVQEEGEPYDEAHVDGMTTVPFFVPPEFAQTPRGVSDRAPTTAVYVLVNGRLSEEPLSIPLRARAILSRSVSAGLNHMLRASLELTATTAQLQGARLDYSAIPVAYPNLAPFDFRAATMRPLFKYGYECAQAGRLWISSHRAANENRDDNATRNIPCPADDEFIGRIASR